MYCNFKTDGFSIVWPPPFWFSKCYNTSSHPSILCSYCALSFFFCACHGYKVVHLWRGLAIERHQIILKCLCCWYWWYIYFVWKKSMEYLSVVSMNRQPPPSFWKRQLRYLRKSRIMFTHVYCLYFPGEPAKYDPSFKGPIQNRWVIIIDLPFCVVFYKSTRLRSRDLCPLIKCISLKRFSICLCTGVAQISSAVCYSSFFSWLFWQLAF